MPLETLLRRKVVGVPEEEDALSPSFVGTGDDAAAC